MRRFAKSSISLVFVLAVGLTCLKAYAQTTYTWTQTAGGSQSWDTASNWNPAAVPDPVSGDTIDFSTVNITVNTNLTLGADRTAENWLFGDTSGSNIWTITNNGTLILAGTTPTLSMASGARLEISAPISGSNGLTKSGSQPVRLLNNATNYSGNTTVSAGLLDFVGVSQADIGGGSGRNITVAAGASVRFNNLTNIELNRLVETTAEIGVFTGGDGDVDFSSSTGANLPNAFLGSYATNGARRDYNGVITPASDNYRIGFAGASGAFGVLQPLTLSRGLIVGGQSVVLVGTGNTFDGETVVRNGGRLFIGNNLALQNSAIDTSTGLLSLHDTPGSGNIPGAARSDEPTLGGIFGTRDMSNTGGFFTTANQNNTTRLAFNQILGWTLNVGVGKEYTFTGGLAEGAAGTYLTKSGPGTQIFAGNNTYTGATTISGGTLQIGTQASSTGGTLGNNSNTSIGPDGVLRFERYFLNGTTSASDAYQYSGTLSGNGTVQVGTNSRFDFGVNQTASGNLSFEVNGILGVRTNSGVTEVHLGELSGGTAGRIQRGGPAGGGATLFIGGANSDSTYDGLITAELSVNKVGSGTLTFNGTNSYNGTTTVSAGTLLINGDNSLATGAITVASGAMLGGNGTIGGTLTIADGSSFFVADLFDPLAVSGTVDIYAGFGVDDLAGIDDWNLVAEGTYTLIAGTLGAGVFDALANNSEGTAFDIGGGRSAYFQEGSLQLVVVPEPTAIVLAGFGIAAVGAAFRRRRLAS